MENIVIDTNVIVSSLISRDGASFQLIREIGNGLFNFNLSIPLVLEYEFTCKRLLENKILLSYDDIDEFLDYLCLQGIHQQVYYLWRPYLGDPGDDMVLELALKSNSRWIVTFNLSDFRNIEQFGIKAIKPLDFLKIVGVIS